MSFEHWVNSFATVTALYGVYRTAVPRVQERLPDLQMPHVVDDGVDDAVRAGSNIPKTSYMDLPENVQYAYEQYSNNGWKGNYGGQTSGTKAGGAYLNSGGMLPKADANGKITMYKEFDVNSKMVGVARDTERLIYGSDGSVYYTNDHYYTFVQID